MRAALALDYRELGVDASAIAPGPASVEASGAKGLASATMVKETPWLEARGADAGATSAE